jgi:hypothetical protein
MQGSASLSGQQMHVLLFSYVFFSGVMLVAWFLFVTSMHKTLSLVPREQRKLPLSFLWMTLLIAISYAVSWMNAGDWLWQACAFVGLIFTWMMLPFGLPNSLRSLVRDSEAKCRQLKVLACIGWVNQVCMTAVYGLKFFFSRVERIPENSLQLMGQSSPLFSTVLAVVLAVLGATLVVSWVLYWLRVVSIRQAIA